MIDQKLIDDAIKMNECCSEKDRCGECPLDGHCLYEATKLNLTVIKGLLEEVALYKEALLYAKIGAIGALRHELLKVAFPEDGIGKDCVYVDDINRIVTECTTYKVDIDLEAKHND